ncbi:oocyte zinc finger protein XlCOF6 [Lingula anatina]|uniref:Oocyte zinc finger protein XlCOF6 n=1 Tax=Lingula anatina TaxID=7574 RepID=A0A1S3KF95_LINAN|nr:oocyte zinc finger protein XlCOF6 [Lingula anatina]|eukprot:XP_013421310.1 oocyte zinc finger protein XlCOF6 [Lingula anatina]
MCMTCNRTFKTWSSASLHIKRKHLKHVHRVCRLCFKECSTLTHLRRHQLVKHNFTPFSGDKMLLKCRLCPRVFLYKKSRKSHEFTKHGAMGKDIEKLGGEQPSLRWRRRLRRVSKFKCGACFRRYTTENRLRIHMIKFHGVKNEQRGSHKCMFCELEFPLPKLLNMHVSDCHNCACEEGENGVVLCMICKQMFLRRGDLKRHLHDIHNLNQPIRKNNLQLRSFRCDVPGCTFSTDSTPTLKIHVETVHPEVVFNCEYLGCTYKSCLKMDVRRHYTLRHERGMGVVCTLCGKKYRKRYHLRIHMFNKHEVRGDGLRTFKCPEEGCEYETTASNSLKLHATKHKKDKPFNCPYCGRCVKTEKTLQKHINKRHLNIRPYLCQVCGASYGEEHELKTHEARHLTDKPYICEHCSYSTVSKADLASHVLARHNQRLDSKIKVYQCHICGYTTTRKKHHERHIKGHLNIRDMVCNICGKTFAHDRTLAKHIRWVHTEKKVKCPHCDHVTADNYHLKEHIRVMHTHRDLKPFKCGYCDFRCKISGNVRKHCLHKHKGVEVKYLKVARTDVVKEVPKRPLLSDVSMRTADVFSSALEMLATQTVQAVSSELSHLSNQVVSGQQQIASVSDQPHIESCSPVPLYAGNQILSVQHVTLGQHVQQQHQEPQHQQHQQPSSIATSQVMTSHMTGSGQLPVSAIRTALMQPVTNQMPPPHPHQHPNLLPPHGHLAGPIDMSTGQIPHWTMGQF